MAGNNSNNSDDAIWIMAFFMILALVMMFLAQRYAWVINGVLGSIAWIHIYPVAKLGEFLPFLLNVPLLGTHLIAPCVAVNDFLAAGGFSDMTSSVPNSARTTVMSTAGKIAFFVYAPFLMRMALSETQMHVDQFYKKKHSLESMLKEQAKSFPTIRMFKHLDPIDLRDLLPKDFAEAAIRQIKKSKGPVGDLITGTRVNTRASGFMRSINPEEWLVSNGLVIDEKKFAKLTSGMFPAENREFYFQEQWENLTIASIEEVLENQLTHPWRGPDNLRPSLKALFAVMTLFYDFKVKEGNKLLRDLGVLSEKGVINKKNMDELIKDDKDIMALIEKTVKSDAGKRLNFIATSQHAWLESAMPTLLRKARFERGVLASASFIWLKREDRQMWYILNATGNDAVNVEAAGAMAHNRAELDLKTPLRTPHVYQAARSILHDYLDCHPDRIAIRKERKEKRRSLSEQIELLSVDARKNLGISTD